MHILVYGISNQKGGISEFMINLNKNMIKKNILFDYIIKGENSIYDSQIKKMNGKVFYYNYKNKLERLVNLYKIMKSARSESDIFYYNTSGTYFVFPLIFAKLFKYKIITHAHCGKDKNINKLFEILNLINRRYLNRVASVKLTCSDVAEKWVYGGNKNIIQINNAVDPSQFFYDETLRMKTRKKMGILENDFVMINVGRVEYPKNQKFLIDLMIKLNEIGNNFKLLLVGDGLDLKKLKFYVSERNIKNIYFLGQRTDINDLLNASDLFLLPSFYEGFPIVAVEAQATGLSCILSDFITRTSDITGIVDFLPLDKDGEWINSIVDFKINQRRDLNCILKSKGFDEKSICEKVYSQINKMQEE